MDRDYVTIGDWCVDAHSVTAAELPERIAEMVLDTIARHTGKATIIEVAKVLAEGLNDLPERQRSAANEVLRAKYGFGFDYFIKGELLRLAKIVARGKVRNEKEHRAVLDALSDTTLDPQLASQLQHLLAAHESNLGAA